MQSEHPLLPGKEFSSCLSEKNGHTLREKRHGIAIENAEEIKFSEADINSDAPHIKLTTYRTCRNRQFAHRIAKTAFYPEIKMD